MSSLRCRIGWHDWNEYGEAVKGYANNAQFKSCKRCNKITYTTSYADQAKPQEVNRTTKQGTEINQIEE